MSKEITYGIIGLILGAALTVLVTSNNNQPGRQMMMQQVPSISSNSDHSKMDHDMMDMSMNDMSKVLKGKKGDDFDKAFIENMIPHHQGAIEMAELALENASHQEIKDLAEDIISAQKSEIELMKDWQKEWGY